MKIFCFIELFLLYKWQFGYISTIYFYGSFFILTSNACDWGP